MNTTIQNLPDGNRLSVLAATFILAYSLTHLIVLPVQEFSIQLPGLYFSFEIGVNTLVALIVAALTASGSDWLLRDHPDAPPAGVWQHTLLPAMMAWVIGIPIAQLSFGLQWWLGIFSGGLILISIISAEYISLDPDDLRHPLAAAWLMAISYALFLILAIALRAANMRLILILPGLALAAVLVNLRVLNLRLNGEWLPLESQLATFLMLQIAAALHYWPLTPIQFGIVLVGTLYIANTVIVGIIAEKAPLRLLLEAGFVLGLTILTAYYLP